ncbi:tyrosine-type recombinase/integrase [Mycobacterium marinum]|uniref:tyrosine-type recombinase/integrase n=1 Tax=Mycobacterium marinum TaxID=1781 RepID=UPI00233F93A4|nr:tyrosine-type recombinase/integrase [Mycobacterium marinum]MDC8992490.1 tyrosine-type recombinase/integrase [Mycobacterium marinum]WDZ15791.1 tyrosine-type recombinase/integrase [Mycobacterium marinum]
MNNTNRARVARKRAQRLGLTLIVRGCVYTLRDSDDITLAVGGLAIIEAYLIQRAQPKRPGPPPATFAPESWRRDIDDYLLALAAGGQRPLTIRLRKAILCCAARGLGCPPAEVTAEQLVNWLGRQQHLSQEGRKSYRTTLRGFFTWMYEMNRVRVYIADALPKVRVPKAPPRPATDDAWWTALAKADRRTEMMLRLAGEAGLRRAEIAQVHTSDLMDGGALLVKGKGGKQRVVPLSDHLVALIREAQPGWLFPTIPGQHLTPGHVGKIMSRALPDQWTAHTLRHRFASRAYRGSRNLRAVQMLLGHESILTTERYVAICDAEVRAAAACAW